jgi:hypothetical protein
MATKETRRTAMDEATDGLEERETKVVLGLVEELQGRQQAVLAGNSKSAMKRMELSQKRAMVNALRAVKSTTKRKQVVETVLAHHR